MYMVPQDQACAVGFMGALGCQRGGYLKGDHCICRAVMLEGT